MQPFSDNYALGMAAANNQDSIPYEEMDDYMRHGGGLIHPYMDVNTQKQVSY